MPSDALKKLSIENSTQTEGEKAKNSIAEARAQRNIQPTVSANDLTNPPARVDLTTPPAPTVPPRINSTVNNVLGSIRSQSDSARKLAEEQASFQTFAGQSSGFDIQNEQLQRFGVTPEKLAELEDIQLQLADRATESGVTQTRIAGAAGQTLGQGQREITQEQREESVRSAGLAARAAVLQGNINTGRQLANDAVNIALQDRTFQANAKLMQINQLKDVVDEESRQLLIAEERTYEAELATIKELKDNVANAIVSGASQSEIATMNDPNTPDADKLALAQSITARGANEMRALDIGQKSASIRASNASAALNEAELVAYNKAQEDAANGILTPEQMGTANDLNKDFESQPIVKAYNEGLQKYIVLEDTLANGIDGVQDLQLVYDFMKSVDPTSVVRETEFATAAKTGNIFQGAYAGFNKSFGTGGFLPQEVKDDFIRAARASFEAKNNQYYNVKSEYANRINNTLGTTNGADYLTAYEGAAPLTEVDFGLADTLSGATPDEILEIMQMSEGLVGANLYK
jgi:hypothetical protein